MKTRELVMQRRNELRHKLINLQTERELCLLRAYLSAGEFLNASDAFRDEFSNIPKLNAIAKKMDTSCGAFNYHVRRANSLLETIEKGEEILGHLEPGDPDLETELRLMTGNAKIAESLNQCHASIVRMLA